MSRCGCQATDRHGGTRKNNPPASLAPLSPRSPIFLLRTQPDATDEARVLRWVVNAGRAGSA